MWLGEKVSLPCDQSDEAYSLSLDSVQIDAVGQFGSFRLNCFKLLVIPSQFSVPRDRTGGQAM